jgi:hypothetical protein
LGKKTVAAMNWLSLSLKTLITAKEEGKMVVAALGRLSLP